MIVNPWIFYWMNFCDAVTIVSVIVMIIAGVAAVLTSIAFFVATVDEVEEVQKSLKPIVRALLATFAVAALTFVLVPSKKTILMMQAAKLATVENVNAVHDALVGAIDYAASVLK